MKMGIYCFNEQGLSVKIGAYHKLLLSGMAILLFGAMSAVCLADQLKPFTSDGCSVFPDGTIVQKDLWLSCCTEHDKAYWKGGTYKERIVADEALKQCVDALGQPTIAKLMRAGVKVGGSPFLPTGFRWGYGWDVQRGYKALSQEELELVKKMLRQSKKEKHQEPTD